MQTRIVPPPGLEFRPAGSGYQFPDGFEMRPNASNEWYLPDSHSHQLDRLLAQGWHKFEEPKPKRIYRSEFERVAIEEPIDLGELLKRCEAANVKLRSYSGKLQVRPLSGFISGELRARLAVARIQLRNFLEQQQQIEWEEI
jgi:hypothetical protein